MKMKNKIILVFGLVTGLVSLSRSQSINNQVINSAGGGGQVGTTGVEVYYNIGETVINTVQSGSNTVTQGFLQPDVLGKYGLSVGSAINPISCINKTDGGIILTPAVSGIASSTSVSYQYFWSATPTPTSALCPNDDCPTLGGLSAGSYTIMVVATYGSRIDTVVVNAVIDPNNAPCLLEIYNGVTPNGDNKNDFFYLGNIDQFPNNVVTIYSRWGQLMSRIEKYDNVDRKWNGSDSNNKTAPSGTYFYVIELGDGSKPIKGWLELLNK